MKKFVKIFITILISLATLTFVACGKDTTFKGKYKEEATEEQITELATKLSSKDLMGTDESESGANYEMNANFKVTFKKGNEEMNLELKADAKANVNQELNASLSGNVNFTMNNNLTDEDIDINSLIVKGEFYTDTSDLYLNGEITKDDEKILDGKNKISLSELPNIDLDDITLDYSTISELINEYGVKLYIDSSDGFKAKISATAETINKAFIDKDILENTNISINKFDIYLSIDKAGKLIGIKAEFDLKIVSTIEEETNEVTVNGNLLVKSWNGTISIPNDLTSYETFNH